jgi:hypothetical protein
MAQKNIETDQDLNTDEEYNPSLLSSKASEDENPTYELQTSNDRSTQRRILVSMPFAPCYN